MATFHFILILAFSIFLIVPTNARHLPASNRDVQSLYWLLNDILHGYIEQQIESIYPLYANCKVEPNPEEPLSSVRGSIDLVQQKPDENVLISVELEGLVGLTMHGFHVHEFGNIGKNYCDLAGGHYNPFNKDHGAPSDEDRHVGDLGNILSNANGKVDVKLEDRLVQLGGDYSVIGRTFVIHQNMDDLGQGGTPDSLTTGNAGPRLACCVIQKTASPQLG